MPLPRPRFLWVFILLILQSGCAGLPFGGSDTDVEDPTVPVRNVSSDPERRDLPTGYPAKVKEISISRELPEEAFPEIDAGSISTAGHHRMREAERLAEEAATADLWQRLNAGFRLGNLEEMPGRVEKFERWYAKHPKYFDRLAERAYWFLYYVLDQVEARNMPAEVAILPAIESAFRPDATSRSRAAGMWQFIGTTGRRFGLRQDWWMDARRDLPQSTRAALDYLDFLSEEFSGDWELAFAAYNAGEGTIKRQLRQNRKLGLPTDYAHLKLRRETTEYVPRLLAVRNILRNPSKYGIKLQPLENRPSLKIVDLGEQTDISVAAAHTSLSRKQLQFLNLGYRRGVTPPDGPHVLAVPVADAAPLITKMATLGPSQRMRWAYHKVVKGDYLGKIASRHGVSVLAVRNANSLDSNLIYPGQELRVPLVGGAYRLSGPENSTDSSGLRKHRVSSGDSLWKISRTYGVSLADLLRWNRLSSDTTLFPGQNLIVQR